MRELSAELSAGAQSGAKCGSQVWEPKALVHVRCLHLQHLLSLDCYPPGHAAVGPSMYVLGDHRAKSKGGNGAYPESGFMSSQVQMPELISDLIGGTRHLDSIERTHARTESVSRSIRTYQPHFTST